MLFVVCLLFLQTDYGTTLVIHVLLLFWDSVLIIFVIDYGMTFVIRVL